jgi:hypothetical protein
MTGKVCLRCDWRGETASDVCPRCGAPLTGGRPSASRRAADPAAPREATVVRSRWGVLATLVVLAFAAVALVIVQRNTPAAAPAPLRAPLGYLVYAAEDDGGPRLWVWNVSAGTATPGPRLRGMPTDLSFSFSRDIGWLSATVPGARGSSRAVVLRTLDPAAVPRPLGSGALVAWQSSGGYVTLANTPAGTRCRRHLAIDTTKITPDLRSKTAYFDVCGRPTMLGRDLTRPYVTMEQHGDAAVYRIGSHGLVPVLRRYRALSVSLNGDLFVQRPGSRALSYFYPSSQAPPPVPITRGGIPLLADRVLGWTGDGSEVTVLGTLGEIRGVFRITVSPEVEARSPALLLRTDARDVSASATETHDVFISTDGEVTFVEDGVAQPVTRPAGAPPVRGPLLWISTLPYSPSVAG